MSDTTANQSISEAPSQAEKNLGFTWWNVYGTLTCIGALLGGAQVGSEFSAGAGAIFMLIFVVLGLAVLSYNRTAFLVVTILSLNPLVWVINGIYLKNRWRHPKLIGVQTNNEQDAVSVSPASPTAADADSSPSAVFAKYTGATYAPMPSPVAKYPLHDDTELYALVADEIEAGKIDKGLWAKMFAESDGDESRTRARYLKARVDQMRKPSMRT